MVIVEHMMTEVIRLYGHEDERAVRFCQNCEKFTYGNIVKLYELIMKLNKQERIEI